MEVLQNDMVVAILGKGDLVGCDIPFSLVPEALIKSSSDVKALTYCDLKSIHVPGLLDVLKMYPEFAETFCTEIIHDLTFNLREGSQNEQEGMLHGAHSLTLPSISEDDEEEDDDDADDDHEDSGSGSPPSSPSTGAAPVNRNRVNADWGRRNINASSEGVPLIQPVNRRPALRFAANKQSSTFSKGSGDKPDMKEEIELTRCSVDRLDSQMTSMRQDMGRITEDLKTAMALLQKICSSGSTTQTVGFLTTPRLPQEKTVSCQEIASRSDDATPSHLENLSQKCSSPSSMTNSSSCSQMLPQTTLKPSSGCDLLRINRSQTRASQTDRSLLEDFLTKMTDSGSPPPNSGYSSSSSNEDRVRLLIGMHGSQRNTEDSESASDDSVLRASNSLTIQSTSSRDVSPYKGSRNSWGTSFGEHPVSPLSSPRPFTASAGTSKSNNTAIGAPFTQEGLQSRSHTTSSLPPPANQCAIDIEAQNTKSGKSMGSEESKPCLRKLF